MSPSGSLIPGQSRIMAISGPPDPLSVKPVRGSIPYFRVNDILAAHQKLTNRGAHFTGAAHLIYTDDETRDQRPGMDWPSSRMARATPSPSCHAFRLARAE